MLVFFSGLLAGVSHVLSGPDHLAAIAPLAVAPTTRGSPALGAVWGIGHGGGVLAWFAVAGLVRAQFGLELAPDALEALVGASLIALGSLQLRGRARHEHVHGRPWLAFAFGLLHGSAGASHLFAVLPTLGLPLHGVLLYTCGYLLAGVFAMTLAASLLARVGVVASLDRARRGAAALAIAVGALWLIAALRT